MRAAAKRFGLLFLLTLFSIAANGYHYATDDGGLYIPAILQRLQPSLYPFNAQFVRAQSGYSVYATVASGLARCLGGSVPASVFVLHCVGVFVLLAAGFKLAEGIFNSQRAAWCAAAVLACSTSIYVAGTSIPIMDPYFTARTLSTPLSLLALSETVSRRWLSAWCALGLAFAVHPLMAFYAAFLIACFWFVSSVRLPKRSKMFTSGVSALGWRPPNNEAREATEMQSRHFLFASRWSAIDWAGVAVPLALFLFLWRVPLQATKPLLHRLSAAAALCGATALIFFLLISDTPGLEGLVRLQPMRSFQLLYALMFLIVGGLLGEYSLHSHAWRWMVLFVALGAVDFALDHAAYPASAHIEWPNVTGGNPWLEAFKWAHLHTPADALFALPPAYTDAGGEDRHGFRALAERSALMDEVKDSGVVSMLPSFAAEWKQQTDATSGWDSFTPNDFQRLAKKYPVRWVVVEARQAGGLDCPYSNSSVAVCRISP